MSALTGILYAALIAYLGGWYTGYWSGNFALLLLILTVVTLAYWLAERLYFLPARQRAADQLLQADVQRREKLASQGIVRVDGDVESARQNMLRQPWWLDWTAGLFPVIHYGIRLPVINKKIISNHEVQRGDVMVFRYPEDTSLDFIKRVAAIPGDEVAYLNQKLYINGKPAEVQPQGDYYDEDSLSYRPRFLEKLGEKEHQILVDPKRQPLFRADRRDGPFPYQDNCRYSPEGVTCKVPAGHYFMLGDNRDNSRDSRFWGFVPDENIVGKAFFVWMNFGNLKRIGGFN